MLYIEIFFEKERKKGVRKKFTQDIAIIRL